MCIMLGDRIVAHDGVFARRPVACLIVRHRSGERK